MTPEDQYSLLTDSVRLVAASADEQVAVLPSFVCVTDEIITCFSDAFLLVPQLRRAGMIPDAADRSLTELDQYFEQMPRDEDLIDPKSLAADGFWAEARRLASRALRDLGVEKHPLRMSGTRWVSASKGSHA